VRKLEEYEQMGIPNIFVIGTAGPRLSQYLSGSLDKIITPSNNSATAAAASIGPGSRHCSTRAYPWPRPIGARKLTHRLRKPIPNVRPSICI
jgi:hypothetical protein